MTGTAQPVRLRRLFVAVLVILGTVVSLLLAHSVEKAHGAEPALIATVPSMSVAISTAQEGAQAMLAPSAPGEGLLGDGLALCASIGLACGTAILFVLMRLRKSPVTLSRDPPLRALKRTCRPETPPRPFTLIALGISRT